MAIYNFDKSQKFVSIDIESDTRPDNFIYNPQQSQYNHDNPDIAQAEKLALESIRASGILVTVYPRTDDNKFDKTWLEDADPTYHQGIEMKAWVKPAIPELVLVQFGLDAATKLDLVFSRAELIHHFGERMIRKGDAISVPYNSLVTNSNKYRVINASESGNFRFRWLYLEVACEPFNKDDSMFPVVE